MSKAQELAAEMQRYGVTTMNRWATDGATLLRTQDALLRQALKALENSSDIVFKNTELAHLRATAVNAIKEHLK